MYLKFFKRLFDILFSIILIILTFPIMIITGIITYFNLGSPIFYEFTPREGKHKKPYWMYKFRTKRLNTRGMPDNKRYSKISKIIDITRINELPQLFNILKGDMSFVGPRPFIVGEKLPDGEISPERYLLRPGVTGLSQASGGQTISHKDKLKYDEVYYKQVNFWYDLKIIVKTPIWVIRYLIRYIRNK